MSKAQINNMGDRIQSVTTVINKLIGENHGTNSNTVAT